MPFNDPTQPVEGEPAKPFEQLLAVFPKQSSHALPTCYRKLYEPDSEIIDFYPSDVKLDINGARYAWMGVNLLPFLDRERLKVAMNKADENETKLTPHEQERNKETGNIRLFFLENDRKTESAIEVNMLEHEKEGSAGSLQLEASFARKDGIAGQVEMVDK